MYQNRQCYVVAANIFFNTSFNTIELLRSKNDFAEVSKNLARYRSENRNNYRRIIVGRLSVDNNAAKSFNIPVSSNILHNYFDDSNKIVFRSLSS